LAQQLCERNNGFKDVSALSIFLTTSPEWSVLFASQSKGELTTYSIVLGDINGQLKQAFAKLTSLHTKNNFSLAIVTGNLFADDDDAVVDLLTGKITIPLPTYFTIATNPLPQQIIDKIDKDEEVGQDWGLSVTGAHFTDCRCRYAQIFTFSENAAQLKHPRALRSLHLVANLMKIL
jgi:hypothetical protein